MMNDEVDAARRFLTESVPEIADGTIQIKAIACEPGWRTKVALHSCDPAVDPVAGCSGLARRRSPESRIDLIRWSDAPPTLMARAFLPIQVEEVVLDASRRRAEVVVSEAQEQLAQGPEGKNQRLVSQLCGYEVTIVRATQSRDKSDS